MRCYCCDEEVDIVYMIGHEDYVCAYCFSRSIDRFNKQSKASMVWEGYIPNDPDKGCPICTDNFRGFIDE